MRFYLHRSLGFARDYFGEIGPKVYVPLWKWVWYKLWKYRGGIQK